MITQLANRGFGYGSGVLSPTESQFIVNIPKNASSYMLDWANRRKWTAAVVDNSARWQRNNEMIVVLRDPLQRWISGISQYIHTYILGVQGPNGPVFPTDPYSKYNWSMTAIQWIDSYNQTTERLLFDVINRFDDHVWPQYEFFENLLPHAQRKYILLDKNFEATICDYLGFEPCNNLDKNSSDGNSNMKELKRFFANRLAERPDLAERVKKAYARDYQLIQENFK